MPQSLTDTDAPTQRLAGINAPRLQEALAIGADFSATSFDAAITEGFSTAAAVALPAAPNSRPKRRAVTRPTPQPA
jgi:hypothetical protein